MREEGNGGKNPMKNSKANILIIDDEEMYRYLLTGILSADYNIATEKSGEHALGKLRSGELPDLILLDVMMPGMDGYEVCRRLKADQRTRHIPVLFITSLSDIQQEAKGIALGAVDFISKPINPPIVKARVKTHLDLKLHRDNLEAMINEKTAELKASEKGYRSFAQIGRALSVERNVEKLLEMILDEARNLSEADAGTLYLVDKTKQFLFFKIVHNDTLNIRLGGTVNKKRQLSKVPLYIDGQPNYKYVSAYTALTGKIANIEDVYTAKDFDFTGPREYDKKTGYRTKSMLVIPMRNHDGEIIGVLQLINSKDRNRHNVKRFTALHEELIASLASQAAIVLTNAQLAGELKKAFNGFVKSIAMAIDQKSPYTGGHIARVVDLTVLIAEAINKADEGPLKNVRFNEFEMEELRIAAWMHDVGKITTPEHFMDKSTRLEMIVDRMELVETRFHLIAQKMIAAHFRKRLVSSTKNGKKCSLSNQMGEKVKTELSALCEDLKFVRSCNQPEKFITPEDIEKLQTIARQSFSINNVAHPYLNEVELENLCISKGTLTEEERKTIENHADMTYKILRQIPFPARLARVPEIAGAHHEKLNGSGYPKGLSEKDLCVKARIIAIADIFEALTAKDRPYRPPMRLSQVVKIMKAMADEGHIDPHIYDLFVNQKKYLAYTKKELAQEQIDI